MSEPNEVSVEETTEVEVEREPVVHQVEAHLIAVIE